MAKKTKIYTIIYSDAASTSLTRATLTQAEFQEALGIREYVKQYVPGASLMILPEDGLPTPQEGIKSVKNTLALSLAFANAGDEPKYTFTQKAQERMKFTHREVKGGTLCGADGMRAWPEQKPTCADCRRMETEANAAAAKA